MIVLLAPNVSLGSAVNDVVTGIQAGLAVTKAGYPVVSTRFQYYSDDILPALKAGGAQTVILVSNGRPVEQRNDAGGITIPIRDVPIIGTIPIVVGGSKGFSNVLLTVQVLPVPETPGGFPEIAQTITETGTVEGWTGLLASLGVVHYISGRQLTLTESAYAHAVARAMAVLGYFAYPKTPTTVAQPQSPPSTTAIRQTTPPAPSEPTDVARLPSDSR
ncbi:MAG: hypothetical protein HYW80_00810 [Parcubacteria group bacterium]|nr:hypothetical protein [Parcubacteria group bacterium]